MSSRPSFATSEGAALPAFGRRQAIATLVLVVTAAVSEMSSHSPNLVQNHVVHSLLTHGVWPWIVWVAVELFLHTMDLRYRPTRGEIGSAAPGASSGTILTDLSKLRRGLVDPDDDEEGTAAHGPRRI